MEKYILTQKNKLNIIKEIDNFLLKPVHIEFNGHLYPFPSKCKTEGIYKKNLLFIIKSIVGVIYVFDGDEIIIDDYELCINNKYQEKIQSVSIINIKQEYDKDDMFFLNKTKLLRKCDKIYKEIEFFNERDIDYIKKDIYNNIYNWIKNIKKENEFYQEKSIKLFYKKDFLINIKIDFIKFDFIFYYNNIIYTLDSLIKFLKIYY